MSKNCKRKERVSAAEVHKGRAISATDLIALINEVNPTGLDLPPGEMTRRYAQKTQLQSLLITRFPDEVEITRDPHVEGFIRLDHPPTGRGACHAPLAHLSEEARFLVLRSLDLGEGRADPDVKRAPSSRPPSPSGSGAGQQENLDGLLLQGRAAQRDYDYEAAERLFRAAMDLSPGSPRPALALLELLVDCLAADREVLALRPELPDPVLEHPEVRIYLALSAARQQEDALALRLLRGLDRPRAAAPLLCLGRNALLRGAVAEARDLWHQARECDPLHPGLLSLGEELDRLQAAGRGPMEEELRRRHEAGDAEAEALAREVLARWPDSNAAGRILREIGEAHKRREAEGLFAQAGEARAAGQSGAAITLAARALDTGIGGALRERIVGLLRELDAEEQERLEARQVDETIAALRTENWREELLGFAALPASLRQRVVAFPEFSVESCQERWYTLAWIDFLLSQGRRHGSHKIVEAARALWQAYCADPRTGLHLLAQHDRVLDGLSAYHKILQYKQEALKKEEHAEAVRRLQELPSRDLSLEELRQEVRALQPYFAGSGGSYEYAMRRAERVCVRRALTQRVEHLVEIGDPLRAKEALEEYRSSIPEGILEWERDSADADLADVMCFVHDRFGGITCTDETDARELCDVDLTIQSVQGTQRWVLPSGREILLCRTEQEMLFLRIFDFVRRCITRQAVLVLPEPLFLQRYVVHGDCAWILGRAGNALCLTVPDFTPQRWLGQAEVLRPGERVESPTVSSDPRYLWLPCLRETNSGEDTETEDDARIMAGLPMQRMVAFDTQSRTATEIGERHFARAIFGGQDGPVVCCGRRPGVISRHSESGDRCQPPLVVPGDAGRPEDIAQHPSGRGFLAVFDGRFQEGQLRSSNVSYAEIGDGLPRPAQTIPESDASMCRGVTTSLSTATSFIRLRRAHSNILGPDGEELLAVASSANHPEGGLSERYRVAVPRATVLLDAPALQRAFAVSMAEDGLQVQELGLDPPIFTDPGLPMLLAVSTSFIFRRCPYRSGSGRKEVRTLKTRLRAIAAEDLPWEMEREYEVRKDDPQQLFDLMNAVNDLGLADERIHKILNSAAINREFLPLRLLAAHVATLTHAYQEIVTLLSGQDPSGLDGDCQVHFFHLLGVAQLHMGQTEAALASLLEGKRRKSGQPCNFDMAIALGTPPGSPLPPDLRIPGYPQVRLLHQAMLDAQACLLRGDREKAAHLLDSRLLWMIGDIRGLALHAQCYLGVQTRGPAAALRKLRALTGLTEAVHEPYPRIFPLLPLPGIRCTFADVIKLVNEAKAEVVNMMYEARVERRKTLPLFANEAARNEAAGAPQTSGAEPAAAPEDGGACGMGGSAQVSRP